MLSLSRFQTWLHRSCLVGVACIVAACSDHQQPTAVGSPALTAADLLAPSLRADHYQSQGQPHERFAMRVARRASTFAGAFVSHGYLVVGTTDLSKATDVRAAVMAELGQDPHSELPVRVVGMRHSLADLDRFETAFRPAAQSFGIVLSGISERQNVVHIGVPSPGQQHVIYAEAARLGVPHDAIIVDLVSSPTLARNLTSGIRPVQGGVQITGNFTFNGAHEHPVCTLTVNVKFTYNINNRYQISAAHCFEPELPGYFGGLIGAQVSQPDSSVSALMGSVVINPAAFTSSSDPSCPVGEACRISDAALAQITQGSVTWDFGGVAQPDAICSLPTIFCSTNIASTNNRIQLSGTIQLLEGDTVYKVGRTTGEGIGVVTNTCTNVYIPSDNGNRLCSAQVSGAVEPGDSGSPVMFKNTRRGTYWVEGLLFGANGSSVYFFSPWQSIQTEVSELLGTFTVD